MLVTYDTEAGATYVSFIYGAKVSHTREVSDLVMIDYDPEGRVVGAEFVVGPAQITQQMLRKLADVEPDAFKPLYADQSWLYSPA